MSHLLTSRRFLPLFVTQFLGAFNDNIFKNALVILITYKIAVNNPVDASQLVNFSFGLFILPYFLFSYLCGQVADKIDRTHIVRIVKIAEIGLAVLGGVALYLGNIPLLLLTLFGFGTHSAFFGPVKYVLLPQHLAVHELIAGNAYVEAATFLAILIGTILGSILILGPNGAHMIFSCMFLVALCGYGASRKIPLAPAPMPELKLALNPWIGTIDMIRFSHGRRDEFMCIIGISWFWFVGSVFLAQFPSFVKNVLHAENQIVTLFLATFSVGIAVGSALCGGLSKGAVRINIVPWGAIGITLFAIDLYFTSRHGLSASDAGLVGIESFLRQPAGLHILFDLFSVAVCGGTYIVPLYTLLQAGADRNHGARAIASNNLINAVFMVASAIFAIIMIRLSFTVPELFLAVALMNLGAGAYIYGRLPR